MNQLDLFAGIGGFSLAAKWFGIETTQFVEIDPYCQQVLNRNFPGVPIHDDITDYHPWLGQFDIITAGFPCQDLSSANPNGRGLEGKRSGLFFEVVRILRAVQPQFLLLENVPALINRGLDRVLWEIAESGFDAEWQVVSAASMGAPHQRERIFIIAYASRFKCHGGICGKFAESRYGQRELRAAHCITPNSQGQRSPGNNGNQTGADKASLFGTTFWQRNPHPEPTICRVDAGLPKGVATRQLKALGNTVVPQCAAVAYQRILEINQCLN